MKINCRANNIAEIRNGLTDFNKTYFSVFFFRLRKKYSTFNDYLIVVANHTCGSP